MSSTRKSDAAVVMDVEVLTSRTAELDHFTVGFDEYHITADGTPVFRGLPDGRCQCPHWGIVVTGEITMQYSDGDETYRAGDAYYARPGHIPAVTAGSEVIEFSPTAELAKTMAVLAANMQATANGAR